MYGTIYRMKPKAGKAEAALELFEGWRRERGPKVAGALGGFTVRTANDELLGLAVFEDEQTYRANANDPEQDRWYRQLRDLLEADPEWHDGAISGGMVGET